AEDYLKANIAILRVLANEDKLPGVYITVNKPYMTIKRVLEEKGIECDKQSLEVILQQVKERHEKKDARWKVKNNKIIESYHKSVEERFTLEDEVLEIARKVLKL
ncbi:MAG: hypothetical protein QW828_02130, partial [Candidatus Bathyarchaeia archaeon]